MRPAITLDDVIRGLYSSIREREAADKAAAIVRDSKPLQDAVNAACYAPGELDYARDISLRVMAEIYPVFKEYHVSEADARDAIRKVYVTLRDNATGISFESSPNGYAKDI